MLGTSFKVLDFESIIFMVEHDIANNKVFIHQKWSNLYLES